MEAATANERTGLLNPIDRISEILFGLIMAVTIVGSMSIATAHQAEVRTVMIAALGCNIAWGLVDAVMYVVRSTTESARLRELGRRIREADAASGTAMIARDLPEHLVPIVGPAELAGIRTRLLSLPPDDSRLLSARLLLEAAGVFALVVIATFPVVVPFFVFDDLATAMRAARIVTLVLLAIAGFCLARYAGYRRPWVTGLAMSLFGAVLIVAVMALGG